ncbi:MAG: hypothetical protein JWO09_3246 [Bacteroidetes bacterium]|nr:hypothetical protein [Bacteroidota bacterium]
MILLAIGFMAITANAQKLKESDVPPVIKSSFTKLHPAAKVEKWEKEQNNYEAEFHDGKTEMSVLLGPNGQLMETEKEISATELPKAASDYVAKNLAGKKVNEASQIIDAKGNVSYEAEVDEVDYIFDANGTFIRKEADGDKD